MDPTDSMPEDDDLTVLEYVRGRIQGQLKPAETPAITENENPLNQRAHTALKPSLWIGLFLVILGQILFGLEESAFPIGGLLSMMAGVGCLWFGLPRKENLSVIPSGRQSNQIVFEFRPIWFAAALAMAVVCFLLFTDNRFGWLQTTSWLSAIGCGLYAFWHSKSPEDGKPGWNWKIWENWRTDRLFLVLALLVGVLGMTFRMKDLAGTPPEVVSAQVETYYSVSEIRQGGNYVLFSRNTVPEPLNYYWANLVSFFSGRALQMQAIRLSYSLAGLVGVLFMYGLGRQIANRWVGLVAAGLSGVSFWLILQERAAIGGGLVFPLMAGTLYCLVRGLDEQDARYFLVSAVMAGLGLMSNKVFLIFPLVAIVIMLIWKKGKSIPPVSFAGLIGVGLLVSLITVMPLLRAISLEPMSYFAPILARVGEYEVSFQGSPVSIFLLNFVKALGIANWSNLGNWVDSIANRGAVDALTAVFFVVGIVSLLRRYRESKNWKFLVPVVLFPLLVLPSALALAFPTENPSMTRAVGAAIPVLLTAGFGFAEVFTIVKDVLHHKSFGSLAIAGVLMLAPIVVNNHSLIFQQYTDQYRASAWNASEMADVVERFYSSGKEGLSYLVSYPYWVDSRAVAISMGHPEQNLSLPSSEIASTQNVAISKLFILNPMDKDSIAELQQVYPDGVITTYQTVNPDKNFVLFIVGQ